MHQNKLSQNGSIATWLVVFFMIGFWVWFFKFAPQDDLLAKISGIYHGLFSESTTEGVKEKFPEQFVLNAPAESDECDSAPPEHGAKFRLSSSSSGSKLNARFYVTNQHVFPVLLTLIENESSQAYGAIFLHPNQSSQVSLPIGQYAISLKIGEEWCNLQKGFSDGVDVSPSQVLVMQANKVSNVTLTAIGQGTEDVMVSLSHSLGVVTLADGQQISGTGSLILQRVVGGHYAAEGSINNVPVNFLVDTGASEVSVSEAFAKHAGIVECHSSKRITANGTVDVCEAYATEVTIGQFKLKNIKINYNKGLSDDIFLLGMNVIGLFKMEQQGDVMKLSLK
jgi:clan AA aspartic protease (TIGR02281 family)